MEGLGRGKETEGGPWLYAWWRRLGVGGQGGVRSQFGLRTSKDRATAPNEKAVWFPKNDIAQCVWPGGTNSRDETDFEQRASTEQSYLTEETRDTV